jgi:RsiW-degrading membrane proteinase PrsW (M82 family)
MNYLFYILFGLAPSIIWLLFYLRKDTHPESNKMIIKIFLLGMLAAIPAALIELGIRPFVLPLLSSLFFSFLYVFLGIALVEEFFKYLVVKEKVLKNPELDEPPDLMIYMIVSALGFAALENLLILFGLGAFHFFETFFVALLRFVGATFLHALASGLLGYFLALSFFEPKRKKLLFLSGLFGAAALHGLYNFSIMELGGGLKMLIPVLILIGLAVFVSLGFKKLKKISSICKIK